VDPDPLWFDAVESVLASFSIDVVGKAASLAQAIYLIERYRPDLVVAETLSEHNEKGGSAWLEMIRARFPRLNVIAHSASEDPADISAVLRSGATAYVVKRSQPDDLRTVVRQLDARSLYLQDELRNDSPAQETGPDALSRREREILLLVADGLSNRAIAERLWVSQQTVKFHLSNVYRKLGVANRTAASRWAHMNGLSPGSADPAG
jgi:DNA-binding NarL/FixJ family response regulator